jgi:hypothetical protein
MTTSHLANLIAAHTTGLTGTDTEPVVASFEVRMHEARIVRQERFNQALGLR